MRTGTWDLDISALSMYIHGMYVHTVCMYVNILLQCHAMPCHAVPGRPNLNSTLTPIPREPIRESIRPHFPHDKTHRYRCAQHKPARLLARWGSLPPVPGLVPNPTTTTTAAPAQANARHATHSRPVHLPNHQTFFFSQSTVPYCTCDPNLPCPSVPQARSRTIPLGDPARPLQISPSPCPRRRAPCAAAAPAPHLNSLRCPPAIQQTTSVPPFPALSYESPHAHTRPAHPPARARPQARKSRHHPIHGPQPSSHHPRKGRVSRQP